jgi:hypothetical protein
MSPIADGLMLYYLKEIHIDKKWLNTPIGDIIIRHELKHAEFIEKIKKTDKKWLKLLIIWQNNLWDIWDCYWIALKKLNYLRSLTLRKR